MIRIRIFLDNPKYHLFAVQIDLSLISSSINPINVPRYLSYLLPFRKKTTLLFLKSGQFQEFLFSLNICVKTVFFFCPYTYFWIFCRLFQTFLVILQLSLDRFTIIIIIILAITIERRCVDGGGGEERRRKTDSPHHVLHTRKNPSEEIVVL